MRKYPQYTFVLDQVPEFEAFKIAYPKLWNELKQRINEGRMEICGQYISPDLHIPNGESLVRNLLYGKKYFLETFGIEPKVGYNLDVFGQSLTKQIIKGNLNLVSSCGEPEVEVEEETLAKCAEKEFYCVDEEGNSYLTKILSVVRKTEKNVAN